jgi:hypothetical protein
MCASLALLATKHPKYSREKVQIGVTKVTVDKSISGRWAYSSTK